ncbi:hypothetical protein BVX98_02795 [bacterium F11]|nr:hypothetical protein BVX98_02795 [bacterium F11]
MKKFSTFLISLLLVPSLWAVETTIKGGKMELLNKGEVILFQNGVNMKRGRDWLKAEEMETTKNRKKVKAKGSVQLLRRISDEEKLHGFGDRGYYNTQHGKGYLIGDSKKAHLIYHQILSSTQTRRIDLYAKRIDFEKEKSKAIAKTKVYGNTIDPDSGDKYEFWADQAEYFSLEKKIVLTGRPYPKVFQTGANEEKRISGKTITYYVGDQRFVAEGDAKAIFFDSEGSPKAQ